MKQDLARAAAVVAALLWASHASAITWGSPDEGDHPQVVMLLFEQGEGEFYTCTGTLLSATIVLTAGHCTEGGGETNLNTWVRDNDADGGPFSLGQEIAAFGCIGVPDFAQCVRDYADQSGYWTPAEVHPHPQFDDYAAFPNTFDVGVAVLGAPIVASVYGVLPALGELDRILKRKGSNSQRLVRLVGYGSQGTIPAFIDPPGSERFAGTATMQSIERNALTGTQSVQLSNNPGIGNGVGGTCFGDSGGPAFIIDPASGQETAVVGSITSFGYSGQCAGRDFNFRMDIGTALDFVRPFLQ